MKVSRFVTGVLLLWLFELEMAARPNVLFIAVDDLRPQTGYYGEDWMITPNMDRLASQSRVFNRHYVQVATCGASRHALLTGRRPAVEVEYNNKSFQPQRENLAVRKTESLPHLFKRHGYHTVAIGKISHVAHDSSEDLPRSWSEVVPLERRWGDRHNFVNAYVHPDDKLRNKGYAFEAAEVDDKGYPDGWLAEHAVNSLGRLEKSAEPFFLAVGFLKPHLPFNAPRKYWDLYDPAKIPEIPYPEIPDGIDADLSLHPSFELLGQYDVPEAGLQDSEYLRTLRHGYAAAVSYADAQVGKVLDELEKLGLGDSTIVVLWGDHGWHLGDLGIWGKHTAFEYALRSPLMIKVPGMQSPGGMTEALTESVDIYPTLAALCGLPVTENIDGHSVVDVLENPASEGQREAFGYSHPWAYEQNPYDSGPWAKSIRTDRYRFTRWTTGIERGEVVQLELYDHLSDPHEINNIAGEHPEIVSALTKRLVGEWVEKYQGKK